MNNYRSLEQVLHLAFLRASKGKGKERHGTEESFLHQDICQEQRIFGINPSLFQIRKKTKEVLRLETQEQKINELLDVIVYAAASVIILKEGGE